MKTKRILFIISTFILVVVLHILFFRGSLCAVEKKAWFSLYLQGQEYFVGFSYALALSFATFSFFRLKENRKKAVVGVLGGSGIAALLWLVGCFLIGCCGSPMWIVYLNLLGISTLKVPKWIMLVFTLFFISTGYWWLWWFTPRRKSEDV